LLLILQFLKNQEGEGSQIKPGRDFNHAMLEQFFDSQVSAPAMAYLKNSQKNPSVERFFKQYRFTKETNEAEIKEKLSEYLGFLTGSRDQKYQEFDQNFSNSGTPSGTWNRAQQKKATKLLGEIFQDTTDLMVLTILMQAYDPKARENEEELMKKGQEIKRKTLDRLVQLEVLDKLLVPYDGFK